MIGKLKERIHEHMIDLKNIEPSMHIPRLTIKSKIEELQWILNTFSTEQNEELLKYVENEIKSYQWILKEIERIKEKLEDLGESVTSKYGIETTLPKGNHITNPVKSEVLRREKLWNYLNELTVRLGKIEESGSKLKESKHRIIFQNMIEGMAMKEIAIRTNLSRTRVFEIKREMIQEIAIYFDED